MPRDRSIPDRLAELVDAARERRAERRRERAELDVARQHGIPRRHAAKLAHLQEGDTMPTTDDRSTPTTAAERSRSGSRDTAHQCGEAPPRRSGRRCGYPGRDDINLALTQLRAALSELARDPDSEARRMGAQLAQEATEALDRLRLTAEQASTAYKRQQAAVTKLGARMDRRLATVQARHDRTTQKGPSA